MKALQNEIAYLKTTDSGFKYMKSSVNWLKTDMYQEHLDDTQTKEDNDLFGKSIS